MLKNVLLLLTVVWIPVLTFSQTTYPKAVVINGDTVIAVTQNQMDSINNTFIWNTQLIATNDSLLKRIDSAQIAFQLFHQSDSIQRVQLLLKSSAVIERDTLIAQQKRVIHHREQQIIRLKVHKGLLATLDVILIGIIGYLIIK